MVQLHRVLRSWAFYQGKKSSSIHVHVNNVSVTFIYIIESVDSISRDEQDVPLTQYITNA